MGNDISKLPENSPKTQPSDSINGFQWKLLVRLLTCIAVVCLLVYEYHAEPINKKDHNGLFLALGNYCLF